MAKVRGLEIYVEVKVSGSWTKVGGQRDATLTFSVEELDVTDKDTQGWADILVGSKSAEVEFDAFLIDNDSAFGALRTAFLNRQAVELRLTTPTAYYTGSWHISKFPIKAAHKDAATVSFSLKASGEITKSAKS